MIEVIIAYHRKEKFNADPVSIDTFPPRILYPWLHSLIHKELINTVGDCAGKFADQKIVFLTLFTFFYVFYFLGKLKVYSSVCLPLLSNVGITAISGTSQLNN